ncbi:hypothetical protein [Thermoanaerobacterium butyriciformans]|uniref:DUF4352 domain-containing protein n=1 Tax=Thermoanaerobacterium butyriciformans TaxID=1702242 RepID=A0ABS4NE53_9THEO|nr:hypothetical protein [Thermoanaerobacterium butyriciformans]MBP2071275.1 hypothetical protein [Thermoanaerobacterium butyriciformans]
MSFFIYYDYYSYNKSHFQIYLYQTNDAPNLNYKTKSKHFKINTTIEIGKNNNTKTNGLDSAEDIQKTQDSNEFTSLNYTIRVENISKEKLNNIKIVVFLDKGLEPYIVSGLVYFGTPIQQKILDSIKKPIKLIIKWDGGEEDLMLQNFDIKII